MHLTTNGNGIKLSVANGGRIQCNYFHDCDFEGTGTQILIDAGASGNISNNYFNGYLQPADNNVAVDASAANSNHFGNVFNFDCYMADVAATRKIWSDGFTGYGTPNRMHLNMILGALTASQFTLAPSSIISWNGANASADWMSNPHSGATANVADGGTISHRVGITPSWIIAFGTIPNNIVSVIASGSTTFTVAIKSGSTGATGSAQTIHWKAGYYSD
jgi:hypothetical protein